MSCLGVSSVGISMVRSSHLSSEGYGFYFRLGLRNIFEVSRKILISKKIYYGHKIARFILTFIGFVKLDIFSTNTYLC